MLPSSEHDLHLYPHPARAREARRRVAAACQGLSREVSDAAQLLTSELVSNALNHGDGVVTLKLFRTLDRLIVEVGDDGPGIPRIKAGDRLSRGRGLLLVEAMSVDWGYRPATEGPGKVVWFVLDTSWAK